MNKPAIDKRLNEILKENGLYANIHVWRWHGCPGCPGPYSDNANVPFDTDMKVMLEIERSTVQECIESESDYVRPCKSWLTRKRELIDTDF